MTKMKLIFQVFLIYGWLNPWMWKLRIWKADDILRRLCVCGDGVGYIRNVYV
jgi:hypothetical protein